MDDEEFFAEQSLASRKFRKMDLLVYGLDFAGDSIRLVADLFDNLRDLAAMHVNYEIDRDKFANEAAMEIERMTGEQ